MAAILSITLPIFGLIGIGYATTRWGLFSSADMRVLGRYVRDLALPALIFMALATRDLAEAVQPAYLLAYALSGLVLIGGGLMLFRAQGRSLPEATVAAMGMSCPNTGYIGYPAVLLAFPQVAAPAFAMNVIVENLLIIPLILTLLALSRGKGQGFGPTLRAILLDLARRPLIWGLVAGLAVSLSGMALPVAVERVAALLAQSTGPVALIVIGGTLVGLPLRGAGWLTAQVVAGKLLLQPLLVAVLLAALVALGLPALSPEMRAALILNAAMPMMGIYPIIAQEAGMEGMASIAMLVAVVVSFVTLTLLLAALG